MIGDEIKKDFKKDFKKEEYKEDFKKEFKKEPEVITPPTKSKNKRIIRFRANDNKLFIKEPGREEVMMWLDPPPYNRDGFFFVPLESLFKAVFSTEIRREGDEIIIERSV